jgi:hypothetical protein
LKNSITLIFLVATAGFVSGQTPASPAACGKNVSFAVAEGGQPVPAIPKFTVKWLGSKSRQQRYSDLCFSQIPSASITNYVVVFSTSDFAFEGLTPSAHTYTSASPAAGNAATISSYGGTWNYAYSGVPPLATTATLDLKRDDKPKSLNVHAYDQRGRVVSRYSLGGFSSREKLLEQVLTDILRDLPPPTSRKPFPAPLSVYYVNCDVDGPTAETAASVESTHNPPPQAEPPPHAPPPPQPELDIWSSPAGADIFLDGGYVGKTPYSMVTSPGEHTISLRKKDFGMWQGKVLVTAGKRRVGASLEQKVLELQ